MHLNLPTQVSIDETAAPHTELVDGGGGRCSRAALCHLSTCLAAYLRQPCSFEVSWRDDGANVAFVGPDDGSCFICVEPLGTSWKAFCSKAPDEALAEGPGASATILKAARAILLMWGAERDALGSLMLLNGELTASAGMPLRTSGSTH